MSFMLYLLRPETCDISHKVVRERKIKEGCFPTDTYRVRPYYSRWYRPLLAALGRMQL